MPALDPNTAAEVRTHEHVSESAAMVQAVIEWVGADHPDIEAGRERAASPWHGAP